MVWAALSGDGLFQAARASSIERDEINVAPSALYAADRLLSRKDLAQGQVAA